MVEKQDVIYMIEDAAMDWDFNVLGAISDIYLSRDDGVVIEKDGKRFIVIVKEV